MGFGVRFTILLIVLSSFFIPSTGALAEPDLSIDIPLQTLNSDQPINLVGLISTQTIEIPIPTDWNITVQSWLDLDLTASESLDPARSSVTISLNGSQVTSLPLDKATHAIQRIGIPPSFFTQGKNTLSFSAVLYLPDDVATNCAGWEDPSRWLLVGPQSKLHLSLQKKAVASDLSHFPEVFLQSLNRYLPDGEDQVMFVLPNVTTQDDLNALSAIAFFLGHEGGTSFTLHPQPLTESQFNSLQTKNSNVIFINNIPPQLKKDISTEKNAVAMFPSPWNPGKTIMVIFDKNRDDGYTPALVLGDPERKVLLTGNIAYLDRIRPRTPPAFKNKYSFEELGYLDRTVRGIGKENLIYRVNIPYNIDPALATLTLQLAHSPDLDIRTSSFSIVLNGFTIASILPTAQNASREPIQVDLPPNRFRPGINFIRFSFDLHLPYSSCEKAPESVWATIFNNTTLEFTKRERTPTASLKDFPMPFSDETPGFSFVTPNQLDDQILARLAQLASIVGASSYYGYKPPNVLTADQYLLSENPQVNYIFIGSPFENAAIQKVNEFLPQPFTKDFKQLQEGYGVFIPSYDQNASTGLLQIIPSPWVKNGTILVLTGTDIKGMDWAWSVILDPSARSQFSGNLMVVGSDQRMASSFEENSPGPIFQQSPVLINIPIVGKLLQRSGLLSGTAYALIAVLAAIIIVFLAIQLLSIASGYEIRKKHRRPKEDNERE
jgi:cellulose synthase subunit